MTSRLPVQSTTRAPRPRKNDMLGKEEPLHHDQPAVAADEFLIRARGSARSRSSSCRYARTTRTPATAPPARRRSRRTAAPESARTACGSPLPKYFTEIDTNGSGMSATSVSRASIAIISASATTNVRIVFDSVHHRRPDHHAHGVEIVGRARHQIAGAVASGNTRPAASADARRSRCACRTRCRATRR